jgi:hypothetical protein
MAPRRGQTIPKAELPVDGPQLNDDPLQAEDPTQQSATLQQVLTGLVDLIPVDPAATSE